MLLGLPSGIDDPSLSLQLLLARWDGRPNNPEVIKMNEAHSEKAHKFGVYGLFLSSTHRK